MLSADDFTLKNIDKTDEYEDYWFWTSKKADEELLREYGEQSCEHVFEVVLSKSDDIVGIKRQFRFNWDVVLSTDIELKKLLKSIIEQ